MAPVRVRSEEDLSGWLVEALGLEQEEAENAAKIMFANGFENRSTALFNEHMTKDMLQQQYKLGGEILEVVWMYLQDWRLERKRALERANEQETGVEEPPRKKLRDLCGNGLFGTGCAEIPTDKTVLLNPVQGTESVTYFARDGVKELFKTLLDDQSEQQRHNIALIGHPGSGKSCLAYAAAEHLAYSDGVAVLWLGRRFHNLPWQVRFFWPAKGDAKAFAEQPLIQTRDIDEILRWKKTQEVQVLFLDAPTRSCNNNTAKDGVAAFQWAGGGTLSSRHDDRRVVHVSSLGGFAHKETIEYECCLREIEMRPWTRQDFIKSLENNDFLKKKVCDSLGIDDPNSVTATDLVNKKFFYSGTNARWFFDLSISDIMKACEEITENLDGTDTEKKVRAINSLTTSVWKGHREITIFTSCHLAYLVGAHSAYSDKFLSWFPLIQKFLKNGAPGKILFESDFAMHLQQSHDLAEMGNEAQESFVQIGTDENNKQIEWPTGEIRNLPEAPTDVREPQSTGLSAARVKRVAQWFIPEDNGQAFLDFMVLVPVAEGAWQLKVIQNTIGCKYSAEPDELERIVRGILEDGFVLVQDIVLACVIENRAKGGRIASGLDGQQLDVGSGATQQAFTLEVIRPVCARTAAAPS